MLVGDIEIKGWLHSIGMLVGDIEIKGWLHSIGVYDYDICDGVVHVLGDVDLYNKRLTSIPVQFGYVSGFFDCRANLLDSLEGCPSEVGGVFDCSHNNLTSLEGCPSEVGGNFDCSNNWLTSLKGCPKEVIGDFDCGYNMFKSKPDVSHIKMGGEIAWK
jgi:hypothetical protein